MDLRQIRYFVAACEEGSLSAAANRLHCTASGVSQQMSALEQRLKKPLLERSRRGVVPTPAGQRFYTHCLSILRSVSEAEIEMEEFDASAIGSIAAGFAPGLAKSILPWTLTRFTQDYPRIDLSIGSGTADALLSQTSTGDLDFYVGLYTSPMLGLTARSLGRFQPALISGRARGLTQMEPVALDQIGPIRLSLPTATNSLRPKIVEAIHQGEILVERTISIASLSAGLAFLGQTDWCSILPSWVALREIDNPNLTINPILSPHLTVELDFVHPARLPLSRPAAIFYDYFLEELEKTRTEWEARAHSALSSA